MKHSILLLACFPFLLIGQGHENTMIFGYAGGSASPDDPAFGLNVLTFTDGSLQLSDNQESECFFNDTDAAISDSEGNLLFYFNGIDIYNRAHQIMENGDTLNEYKPTGYDLPQGAIIIPYPEKENNYILFHMEEGYVAPWGNTGVGLYYSVIDMEENNGLGKVVQLKLPLVIDTLEYGKLAVVRHANGRDWWLVTGESWKNTFYRILIDPGGIHLAGKQTVGVHRVDGIGQVSFSPDGTKYVMFASVGAAGYWQYVDIYDFDRCNGLFSNHEHFELTGNSGNGGAIISPNSRWLYVPSKDWLYKYNLNANPIEITKEIIGTYEPFNDPFPTKFHRGFLAPDNKIYIITTSGSRTLHVIHKPDEPGTECAFEQHGIRLPCNNNSSLPTFANYRLGPLDGSPCDTLGLDNHPKAWYRYEQDTLDALHVEFTDLSYYEPATWSWDFGDGSAGSVEQHPAHQFPQPDVYQVCLTANNQYGSDTHCKMLYIGVSAQQNPVLQTQVQVWPNPFRDRLAVALSANLRSPVFRMHDMTGRLVQQAPMTLGVNEIVTADLPLGIYFWEVLSGGLRVKNGKLLKGVE
ncbi:MAG: PKD domain-containing protein [Saprospiraceae bacterium]|nr:PKD domain-containing protein [Saprospiraceae bacterium]